MNYLKARFIAAFIVAIPALLLISCDGGTSAETKTIPIDFSVDQKTILVNSFANLSDNSDLNIFEDGVATMIEDSLSRIPGVSVIPRRSVENAVITAENDSSVTITEIAEQKGANYMIDGWISRHKNEYRIYANLIDISTGQIDSKAAVGTFKTKDEAVQILEGFVSEIATRVGTPQEELAKDFTGKYFNYDVFSLRTKALASYYKGRPDITVSLLNQALDLLEEEKANADEEGLVHLEKAVTNMHFILAQVQTELHNYDAARDHLDLVTPHMDELGEQFRTTTVALNHEVGGDVSRARALYSKLANTYPQQQYYFIRLSEMILKDGGSMEEALAALERGAKMNPDDSRLHKEIARLHLEKNGSEDLENLAIQNLDEEQLTAGSAAVSALVEHKVRGQLMQNLPRTVTISIDGENGETRSVARVNGRSIDISKLETELDYSCPDTTVKAFRLACVALSSGQVELAEKISQLIEEKGNAPNSAAVHNAINSMIQSAHGDYRQAKHFAKKVHGDTLIQTITWAHLLAHAGKYEKAATLMDRKLNMSSVKDPLILKLYIDTLWLAGDYEQWQAYNDKYLELTEQMKLISPRLRVKMEPVLKGRHQNREAKNLRKPDAPKQPSEDNR